jgi:signal transduction histidine kinase
MALQLRKVVPGLSVAVWLCALVSAGALILITSYLHQLTDEVDANLQSVRAAEEIQLQLLLHSRSLNQAGLMSAPELRASAAQAQADVVWWLDTARQYVETEEERTIFARLETELDVYFSKQAELAEDDLAPLERYAQATQLLAAAYDQAEELLRVNVQQASSATERSAKWDRIATAIGFSVAIALLLLTASFIIGAHRIVYRPLLSLGETIRRYAARDYAARAQERGPEEVRAIARAFNAMADQLERYRAQQLTFVASVAHDLRNPLAAMKAAVEASAAVGNTRSPPHPRLMALVSRQIDVLVRMISDLLDGVRIESGDFALNLALHDARDLVRDAVALFSPVAPLHELVASVPSEPLRIRCDSARMTQIINNLLSNAIKYSPSGGRVELRATARDDGVAIEVMDSGIGIPESEQAAIFEPFRRGRAVNGTIHGVGIGLSVVRRLVEAHGGMISVSSTVGVGSTFKLWLPGPPGQAKWTNEVRQEPARRSPNEPMRESDDGPRSGAQ